MIILVVDGQGGGIGKSIIEKLKPLLKAEHQIIAVGTNSIATANMIKAGANGILAFAVYHILRKRGIGRQLTINHPQTANR